jgi:hypothetical protein
MLIELNAKPIEATEDLEVFKVVVAYNEKENWCRSIYKSFYYIFDKLYQTETEESIEGVLFDDLDRIAHGFDESKTKFITKGFHSANTKQRLKNHAICLHQKIVKCIIPKGSMYYINETGCIVSNQIIVTDKLV